MVIVVTVIDPHLEGVIGGEVAMVEVVEEGAVGAEVNYISPIIKY